LGRFLGNSGHHAIGPEFVENDPRRTSASTLMLQPRNDFNLYQTIRLNLYDAVSCAWGQIMRRREFLGVLGGAAAAWPISARAQQPAKPVIGFLDIRSPDALFENRLRAFRQGLADTGYVERENLAIEYRWAENQADRLPELTAELVRLQVAVVV